MGIWESYGFLDTSYKKNSFEWVITNPLFRLAEDFLNKATEVASIGVALLARTVFLESVGRYNRIFRDNPPTFFAQFSERVPMVKGRLDKKASTATGYAWFVWKHKVEKQPQLVWIRPCQKALEKEGDYKEPQISDSNSPENPDDPIQHSLL